MACAGAMAWADILRGGDRDDGRSASLCFPDMAAVCHPFLRLADPPRTGKGAGTAAECRQTYNTGTSAVGHMVGIGEKYVMIGCASCRAQLQRQLHGRGSLCAVRRDTGCRASARAMVHRDGKPHRRDPGVTGLHRSSPGRARELPPALLSGAGGCVVLRLYDRTICAENGSFFCGAG